MKLHDIGDIVYFADVNGRDEAVVYRGTVTDFIPAWAQRGDMSIDWEAGYSESPRVFGQPGSNYSQVFSTPQEASRVSALLMREFSVFYPEQDIEAMEALAHKLRMEAPPAEDDAMEVSE